MGQGLRETQDEESWAQTHDKPVPGLILVFAGGGASPSLRAIPTGAGGVGLGREDAGGEPLDDDRVSREHAHVSFGPGGWTIRDLGSRNGTFLNGEPVHGEIKVPATVARVLRVGHTLFLLKPDVGPFQNALIDVSEARVVGPTLRAVFGQIARSARSADTLLITGESGSGKELAARLFHDSVGRHDSSGRSSGSFIAVNCAAIPEGVAERLLFGAKKGAYSGALTDSEGYIQAADGGTLFLDEVAELDPLVQAKLLRVLETREVMPLGAARAKAVDVRVVCATHVDLRAAAAEKNFRSDLFYRIGQPEIRLPPLRERLEEIPWLVARELAKIDRTLVPHGKLMESCLLRPWPGNVRELLAEIRRAANETLAVGSHTVRVQSLGDRAGEKFNPLDSVSDSAAGGAVSGVMPTKEAIEAALGREAGNVAAAARALGLHRTQLYRLMKRYGITPGTAT
jgi:transcriptional regulator with PAS, ATPase and Fis domain